MILLECGTALLILKNGPYPEMCNISRIVTPQIDLADWLPLRDSVCLVCPTPAGAPRGA